MTLNILLIVLLSAALHPVWNMMIKGDSHPARGYLVLSLGALVLSLIHGLVMGLDFTVPPQAWPWILMSAGGQMVYGFALVSTYKRGDISMYYPIIRASPLFVIAFSFLFLGQHYDWYVILGILVVLAGGALLVIQPGKLSAFDYKTCLLAVLAMCGTGIYSIADGSAMQMLDAPVLYFYVQAIFAFFYAAVMHLTGKLNLVSLVQADQRKPVKIALLASTFLYGSYVLILESYAAGGDVALVTTVRQISIPLSVLLGGFWLREQGMASRFVASIILSGGIVITLLP